VIGQKLFGLIEILFRYIFGVTEVNRADKVWCPYRDSKRVPSKNNSRFLPLRYLVRFCLAMPSCATAKRLFSSPMCHL